jgi:hypothetical protein
MKLTIHTGVGLLAICLFSLTGCDKGEKPAADEAHEHRDEHADGDEHAHADEGPHGGHIIELGVEDYHAELPPDDAANKVGIYLLGSDAKTAKPIATTSPVIINVAVKGEPTQHLLNAVPQAGEPEGQSSYFETVSEPLTIIVAGKSPDAAKTQARLSLTIEDKPFTGLIETDPHEHDHDHGHAH